MNRTLRDGLLSSLSSSGLELHTRQDELISCLRRVGKIPRTKAEMIASRWPVASLPHLTVEQLTLLGCSKPTATRLVEALRLGGVLRSHELDSQRNRAAIRVPSDVVETVRTSLCGYEEERMLVLLLDGRQRLRVTLQAAVGSLSQVSCHPREMYREAIRSAAHSIILAHNHPSGDPEPSEADVELTTRIARVGQLVGIPLLDHIVVAGPAYVSMAARGLVPLGD